MGHVSQARRAAPVPDFIHCGWCDQTLPKDDFTAHQQLVQGYCKKCYAVYHKVRKYNLTVKQFLDMIFTQAGRCAICEKFEYENLQVDHDHSTGEIRGLLCGSCNRAIGLLGDDPGRLRAAAAYLDKEY